MLFRSDLLGTLEAVVGDPQPGSGQAAQYRFYLREDSGEFHRLSFVPGLMGQREEMFRWAGERVSIGLVAPEHVTDTALKGQELLVSAIQVLPGHSKPRKKTFEQSTLDVQTGSKPWVTVFCKFADISSETQKDSFYESM